MKALNSKRNRKKIIKRRLTTKQSVPFYKTNKKKIKRTLKGSISTFFWRTISSIKIGGLIVIALISLIAYGLYWIIDKQYFLVKEIDVSGNNIVSEEIITSSIDDLVDKWIFFVQTPSLENVLTDEFKYIKSVYVEKVLPAKLSIKIDERKPIAVWRTVNGAYLIDDEGFVLESSINEDVTLDIVLLEKITLNQNQDYKEDEEIILTIDEEQDDEILNIEELLDSDLISQIEKEKISRGNEQYLMGFDFEEYNILPNSYKKYPQVKVFSDEIYKPTESIDWEIWGGYSELLSLLKQRRGLEFKEIMVFSQTKVLVLMDDNRQVYFRLDKEIESQINLLEFVYGRLTIDQIKFNEIDLRFRRPVIRN